MQIVLILVFSQFQLQLHLNSVNAVMQLWPSMQHLSSLKKMNTTHANMKMMDSEDIKDEKTIKQPKKQVQYLLDLLKSHPISVVLV